MIELFNINTHKIDTSKYSNLLHDKIVNVFEEKVAEYVGAKYAASFNSATSAIFLSLLKKEIRVRIPSMIPPVVLNAIITSGNRYEFTDNTDWVGDSYVLHQFLDYKIVDSAQKLRAGQFKKECGPQDLMLFSFYPTKPVGGSDGGMFVSDDKEKIDALRTLAFNGTSFSQNNWERKIIFPGFKMYMNSIQAEIALNNFNFYDDKLLKLKQLREYYNSEFGLSNTSDHLYRININNRADFIRECKENGITIGIHYEAAHLNPVFKIPDSKCPNSETRSLLTASIPFHEKLTQEQAKKIVQIIKKHEIQNLP